MAENTKGLGAGLDTAKIPGHLLLARLGKRVLRPGGRELTGRLIDAVGLDRADRVVEFGPGVGATARVLLARRPASYTGVERDEAAARAAQARDRRGGVARARAGRTLRHTRDFFFEYSALLVLRGLAT